GDWSDKVTVSVALTHASKMKQLLRIVWGARRHFADTKDFNPFTNLVQDPATVGKFEMDLVPISIVYCPPGQDMTNSLTQSESYGTRFTISESSGFSADNTDRKSKRL